MPLKLVPAPAPFIEFLRIETRASHDAIERVPAFARLLADEVTRNQVAETLHRLQRFNAALQPLLLAALAPVAGTEPYRDATRLAELAQDLAFFGRTPGPPAPVSELPALPDPARALGCLYVIEGSSLGGRVIARKLEDRLGLTGERGASFYAKRSADQVRERFLTLLTLLEREAASRTSAASIVHGAQDCFYKLAAWMADRPPPRPACILAAPTSAGFQIDDDVELVA